jgi:hypothetical protein
MRSWESQKLKIGIWIEVGLELDDLEVDGRWRCMLVNRELSAIVSNSL